MKIKEWLIKKLGGILPSEQITQSNYRLIDVTTHGMPANKDEMDDLYYRTAQQLGLRLFEKDCIVWVVEEDLGANDINLRAMVKIKE